MGESGIDNSGGLLEGVSFSYADGSTRSKAIPGHEFSGIVAGLAILADEKCR